MGDKIRMIALDMDGTVLNDNKEVTDYTKKVLSKAMSEGVVVLPCTGRPANAIPKAFTSIPGIDYAISSNGSRIVDLRSNEVIFQNLIERETTARLLDIVKKYNTYREVFWDGVGYSSHDMYERVGEYLTPYMKSYIGETRIFVEDLEAYVLERDESCDKLHIAFSDMKERQEAMDEIRAWDAFELDAAMPQSIEITSPGISKGTGIIRLGKLLGIERHEIMCVGDGMNDASMFREVGIPVAMGNAVDEIKKLACFITDTNNEDGVAKAVEHFLWNN